LEKIIIGGINMKNKIKPHELYNYIKNNSDFKNINIFDNKFDYLNYELSNIKYNQDLYFDVNNKILK